MRRKIALIVAVALVMILGVVYTAFQIPSREVPDSLRWETRFESPLPAYERVVKIATDGGDRLFTATVRFEAPGNPIILRCLEATSGNLLWEQTFQRQIEDLSQSLHVVSALEFSDDGFLYLAGSGSKGIAHGPVGPAGADLDAILLKLDAVDGRILWRQAFDSGRNHPDDGAILSLSPDGTPILAFSGYELSSANHRYHVLSIRPSDGSINWWNRDTRGTPQGGQPVAVGVHPDGRIVVSGSVSREIGEYPRAYLTELDPDTGISNWEYLHEAEGSFNNYPMGLGVAPNGDSVVIHTGPNRTLVTRLGKTGEPVWTSAFDSGFGNDWAVGLEIDDRGDVYACSRMTDRYHVGTKVGACVVKLSNSTGTELWRSLFLTTEEGSGGLPVFAPDIGPSKLLLDSNHDLLVCGTSWDGQDLDLFTKRLSRRDGRVTTLSSYDGAASGHDHFADAAITSMNRLMIAGSSANCRPRLQGVKRVGYLLREGDFGERGPLEINPFDLRDPYNYDPIVFQIR